MIKKQLKAEIQSQVAKTVNSKLKRVSELKSFDTGFSSTVSNVGTLQKISTIAQGVGDSDRIGDMAHVNCVDIIASFVPADTTQAMRLIIFRWIQDDSSAAPTVADILQSNTSPYSPYNRDNLRAKKFIILADHFSVTGLAGPSIDKFKHSQKSNFNIAFQATATTGTNHVYVFMVTDSAAVSHPTISYISRVWYTDD